MRGLRWFLNLWEGDVFPADFKSANEEGRRFDGGLQLSLEARNVQRFLLIAAAVLLVASLTADLASPTAFWTLPLAS